MKGGMKRCAVITALVLVFMMAAVVCLGMRSMNRTLEAAKETEAVETDPVQQFKTVRRQLRAMQKAQLNDIVHDNETDAELAAMARRQLMELCACEEQEITLEGVLNLRGWENPVVTVHKDSVNVILCAESIGMQESSVILELVCRETGVQSGNVKIIPIN